MAALGLAIYTSVTLSGGLIEDLLEIAGAFSASDEPDYEGEISFGDLKKVPGIIVNEIGKEEVHGMKGEAPGKKDLYYDPKENIPKGNIFVLPKGQPGTAEPTRRNIKEFLD